MDRPEAGGPRGRGRAEASERLLPLALPPPRPTAGRLSPRTARRRLDGRKGEFLRGGSVRGWGWAWLRALKAQSSRRWREQIVMTTLGFRDRVGYRWLVPDLRIAKRGRLEIQATQLMSLTRYEWPTTQMTEKFGPASHIGLTSVLYCRQVARRSSATATESRPEPMNSSHSIR